MDSQIETTAWDPLEAAGHSDVELLTAAKKREIKNILKSYVGTYDPMSELIQNAMDSVEKRIANEGTSFDPKVKIVVNLKENSFQVTDNGVGFTKPQFRAFIAPNISFKADATTRGNKGVGATYIAYGFNHLELRTKNPEFTFSGRFRNGRDWVEDTTGTIPRPQIEPIEANHQDFDSIDKGASFKIVFGGNKTRPANLSWYQATTPEQWLYLLLIKTPLGQIDLPSGSPSKVRFDLEVVTTGGETRSESNLPAKYKFPHDEIKASVRLSDLKKAQQTAIEKNKDPIRAIEKYRNSNGIYDCFDTTYLEKNLQNLTPEEEVFVRDLCISAYGYFAYSTAIWDHLNDTKAKLRKNYRVLRGGLQLANNHMAQGDLITIPLTKSIGHQNQTHVIVHFTGAEPDLGRKGFQPELRALAEKIAVHIVGQLTARRDVLKSDTGEEPDIGREIKVHDWIKDQEAHEKNHPLVLINENFFLPTKKISIQSEPISEQDVIVLFNQLLAGGVIRGLRLLATSQVAQYDGVVRYVAQEPFEELEFDEIKNPLGVYREQLKSEYVGPPKILEYKFSLDGLIREFESGYKKQNDVSLAVFWEFGAEYKRDYTVLSLLDYENIQHRAHHGITHVVKSTNSQFYAICLKELIQLLNDPSASQAYQKEMYGEDI
ncbi:MAG: hypothetical protein ACK4PN_15125 [Allorhizobium sp.]